MFRFRSIMLKGNHWFSHIREITLQMNLLPCCSEMHTAASLEEEEEKNTNTHTNNQETKRENI